MKKTVVVDDYHIRNGFRNSPEACPVKIAIDVQLPAFWKCKVHQHHFRIGNAQGSWIDIAMPIEVSDRIRVYDEGGAMQPFQFELWIPDAMFLGGA